MPRSLRKTERLENSQATQYGGDVRLPAYGFVIESPTFVAFLAESWNGKTYKDPTLFTIRSLDGQPIRSSRKVRIYHGFGQDKLRLGPSELQVAREKTLAPGPDAVAP